MGDCHFNWEVHGTGIQKALKIVGMAILGVIAFAGLALLFGIFVKLLWNALMPVIFGLPEISFWQAVGLAILSHMLFGCHHSEHHKSKSKKKKEKDEESSPFRKEMEQDYVAFWREEGRHAFRDWMRRENGVQPIEE
ncbi:MAG: hypothetical protein GF388_05630 [Candidatus Aegiribacteria sp.]|nr:hypothetical protein [Candidatus Aegiribacteria sp.]MBD3294685.1 hypothetical protein [Candidatus Fermentibacteria bacterium]